MVLLNWPQTFSPGAVETKERTWWLDCAPPKYSDADRINLFKIWETALIWLERVVAVAEQQLLWAPQRNPIITLIFRRRDDEGLECAYD